MVVKPRPSVEQAFTDAPKGHPVDSDECSQNRSGSLLPGGKYWGAMDDQGSGILHQLSGTLSRIRGDSNVCQTQEQFNNLHSAGQCGSPDIHKQEKRDLFLAPLTTGQGAVDVVHEEENPRSRPHSREGTYHSRLRVTSTRGRMRLDAESRTSQSDQPGVWAAGGRSFCLQDFN